MKLLNIENVESEILKITLNEKHSTLDTAEETITELTYTEIETTQNEVHREKGLQKK